MSYFNKDFVDFFKGLAVNNKKEWFHANKKVYENEVKKPFYALVQDVIDVLKKDDPEMSLEVKNAVFRINRDIRFSKDKTPYKLHVAAAVSRGGRKDMSYPGVYFHLSPGESFIGGGLYRPQKDHLYKIREAISKNTKTFQKLLSEKNFQKLYGGFSKAEVNKVIPKEFRESASLQPLIFNKSFHYINKHERENFALRKDLLEVITNHYKVAKPMNQFLFDAIT